MTTQLTSFDFRGVHCYRSADDPATFFYVPGEPEPEKDPAGNPQISLLASDKGAILQLGIRWAVDESLLKELREYIAKQWPGKAPEAINLKPAPLSVESVSVALGDEHGNFQDLKTGTSSGYPPFNTIFNLQLTAAQKERIVSALNGQKGMLAIRYRASLTTPVTAESVIEGDIEKDLAQIEPNASPDDLLNHIEQSLAGGRLNLVQTGSAPPELMEKSLSAAKQEAAVILQRMAGGAQTRSQPNIYRDQPASTLQARASLTEKITSPLESSTDVSSWFPPGEGAKYMQFLPVSLPEPS